jgi:hypothetical protein
MEVAWGDATVSIVLQIGISWDAVFDLFNSNVDELWKAFVESQLNKLANQFLGKTGLFDVLMRTPSPKMNGGGIIFGTPNDPIWNHLKVLYWERFLPVGYLALFLSVMVSNFGKAWGFGVGKQKQRQLGLLIGLFLIPGAWYLAIAYLNLISLFSLSVSPPLGPLQREVVGAFTKIITGDIAYASVVGGTSLIAFLLALLVNLLRLVAIWIIVPTLPLIIGFDLGEFPILGNFSRRVYTAFAVLAAVPIPVSIGTRIIYSFYEIANNGGDVFIGALADTAFIIIVPTLAVLVPVYVFMQAADYATIRGATAALSIIGKPASLATSGGSLVASKALGSAANRFGRGSGKRDDGDDGDGDGGGGGGGHDDSGPYPGGGQESDTGRGGLPKRRPSGTRSETRGGQKPIPASNVDASRWTSGGKTPKQTTPPSTDSAPPALPGTLEQADAAGGTARSDVDYVSDGHVVDPEVSFATSTDRAFARSQVIATGMASSYYPTQKPSDTSPSRTATRDSDTEEGSISTSDDRVEPELVDNAAARARRRRGEMRDPTKRPAYKDRRRRQRRQRDRYYGYGDD